MRDDEPGPDPVDDETGECVVPIEDCIDLHSFQPNEVASVVESYLDAAFQAGFREIRIIHGRGIGTQREIVRALLQRDARVASYGDAPPERGGWGATIVALIPKDSQASDI